MPSALEYHNSVTCLVRRSVPASLAVFGIFLFLLSPASAQISASASSSGSAHSGGAAPFTGAVAPPTGPVAPRTGPVAPTTGGFVHPTVPHSPGNSLNNHLRHTANGDAYYPYAYGVAVPYTVEVPYADNSGDDQDADYQGGPTIFDRRGSGPGDYVPPASAGPAHAQDRGEGALAADSSSKPPQNPTTLVFKDGHQIEVGNYAIVSQTLYDLTPEHPRRIALADLDLSATEKQNEDRGVIFQLPPSAQAN